MTVHGSVDALFFSTNVLIWTKRKVSTCSQTQVSSSHPKCISSPSSALLITYKHMYKKKKVQYIYMGYFLPVPIT